MNSRRLPCRTPTAAGKRASGDTQRRPSGNPFAASAISALRWPCLSSTPPVAVAPLRNLTGNADWQHSAEAFAERVAAHLLRHGRGFSLRLVADEAASRGGVTELSERAEGYIVDGSIQCGAPGNLRVNARITDAASTEYLWARRYQFADEKLEECWTKIIRDI